MEEKIIELLKENLYLSVNDLSKLLDHHTTIEFKDLIKALNYLED